MFLISVKFAPLPFLPSYLYLLGYFFFSRHFLPPYILSSVWHFPLSYSTFIFCLVSFSFFLRPPPSLSFLFEIFFSCHQFLFSVTPPLFSLWCVRLLFLPLSHPPLIYFSCSNYPVVFSTYQPTCWALWLLTSANPSQVQFPLSQRIPWLIYSHLNHFPHLTYTSFPLLPVTAIL